MSSSPAIAIIGSGPVGLEAAAALSLAGFAVSIYERGDCAENVRRWGHVRLFSPLEMNTSGWGRGLLDRRLANPQAIMTAQEFIEAYLEPLRRALVERVRFHERTTVVSVGRTRLGKSDAIGQASRADDRFRLLVRDSQGERIESADVVLDCSGTYGHHRWVGAGGIPCPGERELLTPGNYLLPDVLGQDQARFAHQTTLVVGAGYSAATTVVALAELARKFPKTQVLWATRRDSLTPLHELENDALCERAGLVQRANELAADSAGRVQWLAGWHVTEIRRAANSDHRLDVALTHGDGRMRQVAVDQLVANIGYRPERTMTEELQLHECYASQGPIKLAAALLGETSADCLRQAGQGIDVLRNPEPYFFVLGSKSYGRDSRFLMKLGIEQVAEVTRFLCREFDRPLPEGILP